MNIKPYRYTDRIKIHPYTRRQTDKYVSIQTHRKDKHTPLQVSIHRKINTSTHTGRQTHRKTNTHPPTHEDKQTHKKMNNH